MCILTGMTPYMEITPDVVKDLLDRGTKPSEEFNSLVDDKVASFANANNKQPNSSEMKYIYASSFVEMCDFGQ